MAAAPELLAEPGNERPKSTRLKPELVRTCAQDFQAANTDNLIAERFKLAWTPAREVFLVVILRAACLRQKAVRRKNDDSFRSDTLQLLQKKHSLLFCKMLDDIQCGTDVELPIVKTLQTACIEHVIFVMGFIGFSELYVLRIYVDACKPGMTDKTSRGERAATDIENMSETRYKSDQFADQSPAKGKGTRLPCYVKFSLYDVFAL